MSNITKTVDKTVVNGSEVFVYTLNAAYSGLSGPATSGKLTDFFPNEMVYTLPQIGSGIQSITETSQVGGTLVTFNFGPVNNGTSISFNVSCSFGQGRRNNDTFTNVAILFVDDVQVANTTAPTVTLTLDDNFRLAKFVLSTGPIFPGSTIEYTLQLLNQNDPGFTLNNIVITDVLPSILTPDLTFTLVGTDRSYTGFSDPTYNGRTGSFSGNTLKFTLPSYSGGEYLIRFRAIVSLGATPGQLINNTATWTANSVTRNPANSTVQVFASKAEMTLIKSAPLFAELGGNIQYSIQSDNTGNVPLANFVLQDDPPPQVNITKLYFFSNVLAIPSYSILIATSNAPVVYNAVLANTTGPSPVIDLTSFIPAGQRVVSVRVTAPNVTLQSLPHYLALYGVINNTATPNQVITNNIRSSASSIVENISYTTSANTTLNGTSALETTKFINPNKATHFPLDELYIALTQGEVVTNIYAEILEPCAPPVITTTIYCAPLDSQYNPMAGVTATDCQGNNITAYVIVTQNTVNTEAIGSYLVSYEVTDFRGQITTKTIIVRVCDNGLIYQSITDVVGSVALQEAGLSHIINAEGEKIQKALEIAKTNTELLEVNDSVKCIINKISNLEIIMVQKLKTVKNSINSCDCCSNS